jgi:hypothetical protein
MTPTDIEHTNRVAPTREELLRARQRRQTKTFLGVFGFVLLIGLVAFGNWQQWWTIGGSSSAAATICPTQTVMDPELTNINVYNGTTRNGLAAAVAKELQKRKFRVLSIGTEEHKKPLKSVLVVRYGPAGKLAAHTVSLQFPAKVTMVDDEREDEAIDIVIGDKYKGMVPGKKALAAIQPIAEPQGCKAATPTPGPTES